MLVLARNLLRHGGFSLLAEKLEASKLELSLVLVHLGIEPDVSPDSPHVKAVVEVIQNRERSDRTLLWH